LTICGAARIAILAVLLFTRLVFGQSQEPSSQPAAPQGDNSVQPARVHDPKGYSAKYVLKRVDPAYPRELKKKRIQGMVTLTVIVGKAGDVLEVKPTSGHPALAQCATDAVKQWKFRPYLQNGEPVEVETKIYINFSLSNG
jgi:periplasmic protein TonB